MKVVLDKGAYMPEYAHDTDAGADIRSPIKAVVPARGFVKIDTGVHIALPHNTAGLLKSKSGLMLKGILSEGVVDVGYSGEIGAVLRNITDEPYTVEAGDKITQLLIIPVIQVPFEQTDKLEKTERGDSGFGSTGKS